MAGPTINKLEKQIQIHADILKLFQIIKENAKALANKPEENKVLDELNKLDHELYALIMPLVNGYANGKGSADEMKIINGQKIKLSRFLVKNIENEKLGYSLFLLQSKLSYESKALESCKPTILSNNNNDSDQDSSQWIKRKLELPTILRHTKKTKLSDNKDPLAESFNSPFPKAVSAPPSKIANIFQQSPQNTAVELDKNSVAEILANFQTNGM